jgi:thioredoxin type arsenate reductase
MAVKNVMFLCTGNSCRSQMAEGFARSLGGGRIEAHSAGLMAAGVHPRAVAVMREVGIDISGQRSREIDPDLFRTMDVIVTLCGNAEESCPRTPPEIKRLHWPVNDPVGTVGSEEEILREFRRARDEIRGRLEQYLAELEGGGDNDTIRDAVRAGYGRIARAGGPGCGCAPSCCTPGAAPDAAARALRLGYGSQEVSDAPEGANMGLGCGNPRAIAALAPGENVLDLGSGGGFDCFLAARAVGETGTVIGVDMTPEMVEKARENAAKAKISNVEFRQGEIERLPVEDGSIDVIISNCVINLSPEKQKAFREAYRVLRPGGRIAVTDIVATAPLPDDVKRDLALHVGCIAGASLISELEAALRTAGFSDVRIMPDEQSRESIRQWAPDRNVHDYVVSASIRAVKPR